MRILASIHLYPPTHNCGGEYYLHNIFKFLINRGHHCRVILHQAKQHEVKVPYEFEGVEVIGATGHLDAYRWADVILTHLDFTQYSMVMAAGAGVPIVHLIHNDIRYSSISNGGSGNYVVYNSEWIAKKLNYRWPSMVVNPPCDYDYYNVNENQETNEFITLISLNKNKGGEIFYRVAEAMKDRKFLGVAGSYDAQVYQQLPNVTIIPNTPDILSVYKQTRVLLMPSAYESWGMTATEAMCNGIPVIACPTPGLKENLGEAGIYVPARFFERDEQGYEKEDKTTYDIIPIIKAINKLDNKKYYKEVSGKCRARAKELNPQKQLNALEQFLYTAKQTYQHPSLGKYTGRAAYAH